MRRRSGALRSVLYATGGQANVAELYRVMRAREAAHFLGSRVSRRPHMTYRSELPHVQLGTKGRAAIG